MLRVGQQVGRMLESRRCIELVVCMDEAQLHEEPLRWDILRIVTRKECPDPEVGERMLDHPCRRLERVALPPVAGHHPGPEVGGLRPALAPPGTAATDTRVA